MVPGLIADNRRSAYMPRYLCFDTSHGSRGSSAPLEDVDDASRVAEGEDNERSCVLHVIGGKRMYPFFFFNASVSRRTDGRTNGRKINYMKSWTFFNRDIFNRFELVRVGSYMGQYSRINYYNDIRR